MRVKYLGFHEFDNTSRYYFMRVKYLRFHEFDNTLYGIIPCVLNTYGFMNLITPLYGIILYVFTFMKFDTYLIYISHLIIDS